MWGRLKQEDLGAGALIRRRLAICKAVGNADMDQAKRIIREKHCFRKELSSRIMQRARRNRA